MKQDVYLEIFRKELAEMDRLTAKKNADYADAEDAFRNFRAVENLGLCTTETGILTRMSDKFARICNFVARDGRMQVSEESITDTLRDLAVYAIILRIYLADKRYQQNKVQNCGPGDVHERTRS